MASVPAPLSAAILVGGKARRLEGRAKPGLLIGGRTVLARQLEAFDDAGVEQIVLVGRATVESRPGLPTVADAVADAGALGGLYTALLTAVFDPVLVLAGDMPFVTAALFERLAGSLGEADAAVARTDRVHPLCGCYRRSAARRLKPYLDARQLKVSEALRDLRVRDVGPEQLEALDRAGTMLMNVNTPLDYERACRVAAGEGPRPR